MFQSISNSRSSLLALVCLCLSACGNASTVEEVKGSPSVQDGPEDVEGQGPGGGVDASGTSSDSTTSEMTAEDKSQIDRGLEVYQKQVTNCYRVALNQGDTAGTLTLTFDIDASGQAMNARTTTTGTLDSGLTACVESAVGRWSFKDLTKDYSNIQIKYVLEASEAADETETAAGGEASPEQVAPETTVLAADQTKVQRRLGAYERQVQHCYRLSLANGEFAGTLALSFDINVYGSTENVRVTTTGTWDDRFETCITSNVERWTFKGLTKPYSNIETNYVLSADEIVRE